LALSSVEKTETETRAYLVGFIKAPSLFGDGVWGEGKISPKNHDK
jgi:hypothetical protein